MPDSDAKQACQFRRQTARDVVCIGSADVNGIVPDHATGPGGPNDKARNPTSFHSSVGRGFGDRERVTTTEKSQRKLMYQTHVYSIYYADFDVITVDLDWSTLASLTVHLMGLTENIHDSFTYRDMPEELPAFVTVYQKWMNQFRQRQAEKADHNTGKVIVFATPMLYRSLKDN